MDTQAFRHIAMSMPGALEGVHQKHPDFRVNGKVFATLGYPDAQWGMVKLTPDQQQALIGDAASVFQPAAGAWGRQGSTLVRLEALDETVAADAITMAWANIATA